MTSGGRPDRAPIPPGQLRAPLSVTIGWTCIGFAPLPFAIGLLGAGRGFLAAAAALVAVGVLLVAAGRRGGPS